MSRTKVLPTPKPKSRMYKFISRARKPKIPPTTRSELTRRSTVKPDQLLSEPIRHVYKLRLGSVLVSSPHLVSESLPGQIENPRPKSQTSRDHFELDHTLHPRSNHIDGSLYPILNVGHVSGEDASQGIATFIDQVNKFTSRLTSPVPDDLTALVEYQQDSLVMMRMATREVVGAVERRLGLGREEINDEEGFQTWSNGMLALFEMIVKALYCRIKELKYLVHRKGEVVRGIVDGMMVLAPGLLQFDVTDERSLIVEDMLGETYGIHVELMKFRKVKGRLREVIDQWYEGSTWIDPREDSDTNSDETGSNDISEEAIISQEVTNDHSRELLDLPTSIQDSDLSSTHGEVCPIQDFVEALDTALRHHLETDGYSEKTDISPLMSEGVAIRSNQEDESLDIEQHLQRDADIVWLMEEERFQAEIKLHECFACKDDIIEEVNSYKCSIWEKGEERDFIEDVEYHKKEIWIWEDALEMQRELELDEILFWESDEGRELKADLELDEILFWESEEGRELKADMELDEYLMSISEEAMEFEREFELERFVAEEAAFWEKEARLERKRGVRSS
jgi:hypothetical protein